MKNQMKTQINSNFYLETNTKTNTTKLWFVEEDSIGGKYHTPISSFTKGVSEDVVTETINNYINENQKQSQMDVNTLIGYLYQKQFGKTYEGIKI